MIAITPEPNVPEGKVSVIELDLEIDCLDNTEAVTDSILANGRIDNSIFKLLELYCEGSLIISRVSFDTGTERLEALSF